ncbi:MAG: deoxyribonuclease IV [Thermodesulfobacteriota bacterium]
MLGSVDESTPFPPVKPSPVSGYDVSIAAKRVSEIVSTKDMRIGVHVSIAQGLHRAFARGAQIGCTVIQIFTRNATRWHAHPLDTTTVKRFLEEHTRTGMPVVAHGPYLINPASPDPTVFERSVAALREEIERTETLGIRELILHPGAHKGSGVDEGLERVATTLNVVLKDCPGYRTRILLENTAGQGTGVGHRFEHLGRIIARAVEPARLGICFDTCHAHAAGYDLTTESAYRRVFEEFDREIGLDRLKVLHFNDCKRGLGEKIDRHEHIGLGSMGIESFRLIMNDRRFSALPKILETPKLQDGKDMDPVNLSVLRSLVEAAGSRNQ